MVTNKGDLMPIRPIYNKAKDSNKKYKGVYELINTKNKVTGYYVNYADEFGKTHKVRAKDCNNKDEALLYLNQLKHDVKRAKQSDNNYKSDKRNKKIKLNDLATEYFDSKGDSVNVRVRARYDNHIRNENIGSLIVDSLTMQDAEGIKAILKSKRVTSPSKSANGKYGLADGTINHILAMVKTIIKFGIQNRYCTTNIFDNMDVNRKSQERLKVLTPDEVSELIENASYNNRLQIFLRMLYYTAQRPKSIIELQRKHIDLKANTIAIASIKNQKPTTVPIAKVLLPYLEEWIKDLEPTEFLFHRMAHPKGGGFTDKSRAVSFTQLRKSAKKLFEPYNAGLDSRADRLMVTSCQPRS